MTELVTIDLSRFKKVKQDIADECIACCLESVLSFYGYKDKSKNDFYSYLKPKGALHFKGVIDYIAPLYPKLNFIFENHKGDITLLIDYIICNIMQNIPIITAIKSDYFQLSQFEKRSPNQLKLVLDITNTTTKSTDTHIITIVGYDKENIYFYEQGVQNFISLNYKNSIFADIIQGGKYDTLLIYEK